MDKIAVGLIGAVAGLATIGATHAASASAPNGPELLQASSYADLLAPVPNAVALLQADNAARVEATADLTPAFYGYYTYGYGNPYAYYPPYYSYGYPPYYHHHHHHHHFARRHHHHHHHHNFWRR